MKRMYLIAVAMLIGVVGCNGQTKHEGDSKESSNNPQTNIKVNKEYDKNGNIVRYDSTYSYYYSNVRNNRNMMDSIFNNFKSRFNQKYSFSEDPYFNRFFFQDSLLKYDFYKKDFFLNRFKENMRRMDSLFWGMDAFKNDFFRKQFEMPEPLIVPKKEQKN
jgi:hypothetical protein